MATATDNSAGSEGATSSSKEKKLTSLHASITALETETAQLEAALAEVTSKLSQDASATVQWHIRLLHEYNEIKDVGQGLMGLIAEARGVRVVDVQREYGVGEKD